MKKLLNAIILAGCVSGAAGCAMFNRTQVAYTRTTTVGRELLDLQEAREKGAISEAEYNKARKALLEGAPATVSIQAAPAP